MAYLGLLWNVQHSASIFMYSIQPLWLWTLQWRHNGCDSVSNHQPHDCLFNCLIRRRSKKTSKLRVTGLCAGNSSRNGKFPAQMTSDSENVSIWRRHGVFFTNVFFYHNSYQMEIRFTLTPILTKCSLKKSLHDTTAVLPWYVQKSVAIWGPFY